MAFGVTASYDRYSVYITNFQVVQQLFKVINKRFFLQLMIRYVQTLIFKAVQFEKKSSD